MNIPKNADTSILTPGSITAGANYIARAIRQAQNAARDSDTETVIRITNCEPMPSMHWKARNDWFDNFSTHEALDSWFPSFLSETISVAIEEVTYDVPFFSGNENVQITLGYDPNNGDFLIIVEPTGKN